MNNPAAELLQAQTHIYNHVFSFVNSMALKSAVELGIPDAIHTHGNNKPMPLTELAAALGIEPERKTYLHRLMRLLVHSGFFFAAGEEEPAYALTPSSKLLVKDNPNCLSSFVKLVPRPEYVTPCYVMGDWINGGGDKRVAEISFKPNQGGANNSSRREGGDATTSSSAFERAYGMPFWEYTDRNAGFNALFNDAMAEDSGMMNLVVGDCCGAVFRGVESLVDVGGGTGTFARIIVKAFPGIRCQVLDLPQVIGRLAAGNSSGKLEFVEGDMFQCVPSAGAVLLRMILHDWKDEECVKILKKCKDAISSKGEGGKVIIIDIVMDEKQEVDHELAQTKLNFDMVMMFMLNGKERTEKEWERLFFEAGFQRYKVTPLFGFRSLIEVFP
ncbi:unnamed protein product [Linum trigynum]|uniref:Trans-resveratrol di-O-methyltransferase-like n=1 Tax=Linum trigynum TaxID=586398 RepID=A0AAV2GHP2_9ROSI